MSIFNIFKSKKKIPHPQKPSVEEQLRVLADLGIKPKQDGYVEWVCYEWDREDIETLPYNLILYSLGGERENAGIWERSSDDVFSFDIDCVDNENIYAKILIRLVELSKGMLNITNIISIVDHENQTASISFRYDEINYSWDLKFEEDLFDKMNQLLKESGSSMFFYICSFDKNLIVLFESPDTIEKVNGLVTIPFIY